MTLRTLLLAALLAPAPALAVPDCPTDEHRAELSAFSQRLRASGTADEARNLALAKVRASHRAVDHAARLFPNDAELLEQQALLDAFEADVRAARSPTEVASRFDALQAGAQALRCHYSTGEVVAIVVGFILGVIPGIILLILLC